MLVCSHILAGQDLEKIIKKMIIYYSAVAITESKQYNEHKQQQKQTSYHYTVKQLKMSGRIKAEISVYIIQSHVFETELQVFLVVEILDWLHWKGLRFLPAWNTHSQSYAVKCSLS